AFMTSPQQIRFYRTCVGFSKRMQQVRPHLSRRSVVAVLQLDGTHNLKQEKPSVPKSASPFSSANLVLSSVQLSNQFSLCETLFQFGSNDVKVRAHVYRHRVAHERVSIPFA